MLEEDIEVDGSLVSAIEGGMDEDMDEGTETDEELVVFNVGFWRCFFWRLIHTIKLFINAARECANTFSGPSNS